MAKVLQIILSVSKKPGNLIGCTARWYTPGDASKSRSSNNNIGDVPGLSSSIVSTPDGEVGPGASKTSDYKNPEYFSYNRASYHEAEIELHQFRLPQPSSKVPLKPQN